MSKFIEQFKHKYCFITWMALSSLFTVIDSKAQQDITSYYMQMIPQSVYHNPANIPECRFYIGFPAISSIYFGLSNNAFKSNKILQHRSDDSIKINLDVFLNNLQKNNYIDFDLQMDILAFGFKVRKSYFTIELAEKVYAGFNFPKDFMAFFIKGNLDESFIDNSAEFSNIGINAMAYHQLAIGYNRRIGEKWTMGIRPKMILGIGCLQTKKSDLKIYTADETNLHDITITSAFDINTNLPSSIFHDSVKFDPLSFVANRDNIGWGIDLGVKYKITRRLSVSLAATDLGYINWVSSPKNFAFKSDSIRYTFQGLDLNDLFKTAIERTDSTSKNTLSTLSDSLSKVFETKETNNSFKTSLNARYLADISFALTKNDKFGVMAYIVSKYKKLYPVFMLSYNRKFGRILHLSISYSNKNNNSNLGAGMALCLGPLQIYTVTDNILGVVRYDKITWKNNQSSMFIPSNINTLNVHFGVNFVFGKEKPVI